MFFGDAGFFAALGGACPAFGKVEAYVDEGGALAAGEAGADGDLAVFDFADASDVLAGYAYGVVAFFEDAGVVEDESGAGASSE